jgi:hypothetical protein
MTYEREKSRQQIEERREERADSRQSRLQAETIVEQRADRC